MARGYAAGDPRAKANGAKGGARGAKTKRIAAIKRASAAAGRPLTASEAALYRLAYENGRKAGDKAGWARGYRAGWNEALGEGEERTWV